MFYIPIKACRATTIISVCRRPYSSDSVPLDRLPIAAPARKHISITFNSVASSHTTFHSDCMVASLLSLLNSKRVHFSIALALWLALMKWPYFKCCSRSFTIEQAPFGWEISRHSLSEMFVSMCGGIAHQKSRSIA